MAKPLNDDIENTRVPEYVNLLNDPQAPMSLLGLGSPLSLTDAKMSLVSDHEGPLRSLMVIRHGTTDLNAQGDAETSIDRIRGWSDIPLNDIGRDEARKAARALKGQGLTALVHSDLSRAAETAAIIGDALGIKVKSSKLLRPWDLGYLTGESTDTALPVIEYYVRQAPDEPVPSGESFSSFCGHAFQGVAKALRAYEGLVGIVTHHRVERLLVAWNAVGQPRDRHIDLDSFLQRGEAPGSFEHMHISEAALAFSAKVTQEVAHYRMGSEGARCDMCTMWRGPHSCTAVEGHIDPEYLCDYYARKPGTHQR